VNGYLIDMSRPDWMKALDEIMAKPVEELELISRAAMKSTRRGDSERNQKLEQLIQQQSFFLSKTK
jgi:hypothetical protein